MSKQSIKTVAFIFLLVHGIGHLQGVMASLGIQFHKGTQTNSWVLKALPDKTNSILCMLLYGLTALMGISAALSFFNILIPENIWTTLSLICAFVSALALILFPNALAVFFNKAGAIMVNLMLFYSILFQNQWPTEIFE